MSAFWNKKKAAPLAEQEDDFETLTNDQLDYIAGGGEEGPEPSGKPCWICESINTYTEYVDGQRYLVCRDCDHRALEF